MKFRLFSSLLVISITQFTSCSDELSGLFSEKDEQPNNTQNDTTLTHSNTDTNNQTDTHIENIEDNNTLTHSQTETDIHTDIINDHPPVWPKIEYADYQVLIQNINKGRLQGSDQPMQLMDVNNDGLLDLVSNTNHPEFNQWFLQQESQEKLLFQSEQIPQDLYLTENPDDEYLFIDFIQDLNNDGLNDVLGRKLRYRGTSQFWSIYWKENLGEGLGYQTHILNTDSSNHAPQLIDINQDQQLDIVYFNPSGEYELQVFDTINKTWNVTTINFSEQMNYRTDIHVVDINNDGHLDFIKNSNINSDDEFGKLTWKNINNLSNEYSIDLPTKTGTMQFVDMDFDNDLDIILLQSVYDFEGIDLIHNADYYWLENDGNIQPSFKEHHILHTKNHTREFMMQDIDQDGDLDFIYSYFQFNKADEGEYIDVLENITTDHVHFQPIHIDHFAKKSNLRNLYFKDINNDGNNEILIGSNILQKQDTQSYYLYDLIQYNPNQINLNVAENNSLTVTLNAQDNDNNKIRYSLITSEDSHTDFISINENTGELIIENAPMLINAQDKNKDNIYHIWVSADDGKFSTNQAVKIRVYQDDGDADNDGVIDLDDQAKFNPYIVLDNDQDGIADSMDSDDNNENYRK